MKILGTNFKKIKAQHSMEILILVAFISLFVIFLLFTYTEIRSAFGRSTLDASAQDLTNQLNRIAATGSDTQYKISLNLPRNLEQVDYSDGFLTFMADETVLSYPVRSPIVGEIGSIGNVNAEFLPSNYGGYVCIYPPHKYQECCVDLLCSLNQLDCYVNGAKDTDCDGMPDWYDLDIDGDGTPNEFDPNISNKFISNPDFYLDKDENGIYEWYKNNIDLFLVNWGVDSDGDGVPDFFDKDPNNPNVGAEDNNNNNIADWLEFDFNNNGIPDWYDNDLDGDGVPNIFDSNPHHPLVGNETNPHTNVPLWLEIDTNNDGIPDWYSIDKDGDSVPDKFDDYPLDSTRGNEDNTGDGYPDWLTQDTSGDGIPDWWYGNYLDSDGNGVPDRFDASPFNPEIGNEDYYTMQYNPDGTCNMIYGSNGIPDWMEFDFDCDGVP
ncbi:MAG: thrombospondin type 3 repeat-containing protein, partial [Candidatus Woesearchaeota archaeon]